ncbi:general transcription factor II-I repeat domain-containing protein 2 [Trichonephila inaurata madagascariensis]|uniref:General transcription factor II-I repeat domain-containing protein 2 n=1 Tax=Trichonephila inaurata madagascariensis TaxID=2747483 RepID=A0A8X6YQ69_9ARAC|nr:general transcription factor II-I repeat domain-containing protein 2 [Trichonephila inaurata madagascariensis]
MFKNCRKEDLRIVALELGETVAEKELIQVTIEDRKNAEEECRKAEEARLREKELELELVRLNVRVNSDNERTGEGCNSLDALVKSVRILTVKVPNRPEERKTVNRDLFVLSVKRGIIKRFIIQSERKTRKDPEEERLRIVEAAATIIREDIRSSAVETKCYPPPSKMLIKENQEKKLVSVDTTTKTGERCDVDVLIVETAIEESKQRRTAIPVGEDIDLLVILIERTQSHQEVHTTETEFPVNFAIETLSALKINFDTRFSDFDVIANEIKLFQKSFDSDIETLALEVQMEIIDLQCSDMIKNKYQNSSLLEFYKSSTGTI